jgi:RNA polymerase sigma factor (sigma-70 family)
MPRHSDDDTTSPTLIARVGDWRDHDAWSDFVRRYDPAVRLYCRTFAFDSDTLDDLIQQIWIELARRLKTYRYDPSKTFRGWLSRVCRSRAIDVIRKRKAGARPSSDLEELSILDVPAPHDAIADEPSDDDRPEILMYAEAIQARVKCRVDDRTWTAFWRIVVESEPVRETATAMELSYAAAFAAQKRVARMLQEEGQQFLLDRRRESPESES